MKSVRWVSKPVDRQFLASCDAWIAATGWNDHLTRLESGLWMQATYHGRNFARLQIDSDEWLSSFPIPER